MFIRYSSCRAPPAPALGRNVKYVVPQYVSDLDRDIDFYFRVEHPERAVAARILAAGRLLAGKKHRMVRPPEMIKQSASAVDFAGAGGAREITVEVVAGEEQA